MNSNKTSNIQIIVDRIKSHCRQNLYGFWEEIDPANTCHLLVQLAEEFTKDHRFDENEPLRFYLIATHTAILLNAALRRTNQESLKQEIRSKINNLALQTLNRSNMPEHNHNQSRELRISQISETIKNDLIEPMRDRALNRMNQVQNFNQQTDVRQQEKKLISDVENNMKLISDDYTALMKRVSDETIKIIGKLPCNFTHIAMGSLSRNAITPYSDFENAIIFEDTNSNDELNKRKGYFRLYAAIFEMIVIGFGEAPIRLTGIKCLNNFTVENNKSADWFWDLVTPSGIQFDNRMPFASKVPFGRPTTENKKENIELIGAKSHILQYLDFDNALKEGYHLAEMLSSSCFVAGCHRFFNQFYHEAQIKMNHAFKLTQSLNVLLEDYKRNLTSLSMKNQVVKYGSKLNVKKSFYKWFSIFFIHLERLTGIQGSKSSSHTVQQWFNQDKGINEDVAHNLLYALSLVNKARLKLYFKRKQQSDFIAGTHYLINSETSESVFSILQPENIVVLYEIGLNWNNALLEILETVENADCISKVGNSIKLCLNKYLSRRNNYFVQAQVFMHFHNYDKAIELFEKSLKQHEADDTTCKCKTHLNIGKCLVWSLKPKLAEKQLQIAMQFTKKLDKELNDIDLPLLAEVLEWLGRSLSEFDTDAAKPHIINSEKIWLKLHDSNPSEVVYLRGLADVTDSRAWLHYRRKEFEESLQYYKKAAELFRKVETATSECQDVKNEVVNVQTGIGLCYHGLKK